jgi:hypothetical protein
MKTKEKRDSSSSLPPHKLNLPQSMAISRTRTSRPSYDINKTLSRSPTQWIELSQLSQIFSTTKQEKDNKKEKESLQSVAAVVVKDAKKLASR